MLKKLSILILLSLPISLFSQDLHAILNSQGKYGFIDKYSDTLIDCKYDYAEDFNGGLALIKNNLQYKVVDTAGNLHDLSEYDGSARFRHDMGEYHAGLPVIVKKWDCSFISSSGEVFLSLPYQDASSFNAGKAKVIDGDKYNYISKSGLLLDSWKTIPDDYHAIKFNNKVGFIDKDGKLVIDYQFDDATDFKNGYAQISNGTYWAVIDKQGRKLSDWYEKIGDFQGNTAIVEKIGNIGFINNTGKFMGQWYKSITPLDYGLYKVEKYDKFAIVNNEGFLVTQWFDEIDNFKSGYLKVKKEEKYAYLNKIGALVVGWYDNVSDVKDDIIKVTDGDKFAFYNLEKYFTSDFFDYLGKFKDGLALVQKGDKFGFVDKNNNMVIPLIYEKVTEFNGGVAQVVKDGKAAYINTKGDVVMGWYESKSYIYNEPPRGLVALKFGTKYGYQTINGRRLIAAKFDYAENFSDGIALVKNKPRQMYIDVQGNLKPLTAYPADSTLRKDLGYGHSGDPIKVTVWDCGYIDYSGNYKIQLNDITDAFSFDNNKAKVVNGDKYNYIDKTGKIISTWKDFPDDYHANYKNGRFGYIDKNGNKAIDYKFNYAYDFHNGIAKVRVGNRTTGKFGYINRSGNYITKMYNEISDFKFNIAIVRLDDKYCLIDTSGNEISKWYDKIDDFSEQLAVVKIGDKYSYINTKGVQFSEVFDAANDFKGGRAKVKLYDKWGFVDRSGELIVRNDYDNAWDFQNNIAKVEKNNKFAFIDLNGRLITDWFDRIFFFSDDRAVFVKDKKWGYIDLNGKIVINPIYDRAFAFSNGEALVVENGTMIKIDKDGKTITDDK